MSIAEKSTQAVNEAWFDEFIAAIRTQQLQLETNTASEEMKDFYNMLINGSQHELAYQGKRHANMHFIRSMVIDYINKVSPNKFLRLAFDMDNSEVLVWAEIEDHSEDAEDHLLLAEAEINAKYHRFGYDLTSTIVEKSDCLPIPNHYVTFKG